MFGMEETNTKTKTQKQNKTKKEKYEKTNSWLQKQVGYFMKRLTIQKEEMVDLRSDVQ